jgi:putative ABC transport system ATP-binding protein
MTIERSRSVLSIVHKEDMEAFMALLEVKNLKKIYTTRLGGNKVQALTNVTFSVENGEYVAIMGESGSGKTTLLNIMASLDKPSGGQVILAGKNVADIKQKELCAFRRDNLGFVFQDFNLLDTLSLKDNIFLPLVLAGLEYEEMNQRLLPLTKKLGIEEILEKYPYEVSGGQKQRTAVARALITRPQIILADEPTGALDSKATSKLLGIFADINRDGQTILMVTHSIQAASRAGRVLFIKDGCVFNQIYRGNFNDDEMYRMISDTLTVLQTGSKAEKDTVTETTTFDSSAAPVATEV